MIKKYPNFEQSSTRAWIWIAIMGGSVLLVVMCFLSDRLTELPPYLTIIALAYWADQLEKELTRRNKIDRIGGELPPPPKEADERKQG